ncbi:hypothetical protein EV385_6632 [Krasilnikovia cinnamomea]|uniref:Uncharacterized protein n=1 Tax=Krasilnikovia cinnamomea TaxID=349313 RepID=A0A4Q7Z7Z2_9ACTN|nr:hypothetical protein [Krasilnikovia cinnamomea]RZU46558.1 hypothetical protein EV385_6632 [Krasilnikovia cinnamomea]
MNTDDMLALAEDLLTRPYPPEGYHAVDLEISDDFSDDPTGDRAAQAWQEFDAECARLAAALTIRWGTPQLVTLDQRVHRGTPLGAYLADFVAIVHMWHRAGRTVCLGVGQGDKELPIQFVLTVGNLTA